MLKGRLARGVYELLVQWKNVDAAAASWIPLQEFRRLYPAFQLDDELLLQGGERCHAREHLCEEEEDRQEDGRNAGQRTFAGWKWLIFRN